MIKCPEITLHVEHENINAVNREKGSSSEYKLAYILIESMSYHSTQTFI